MINNQVWLTSIKAEYNGLEVNSETGSPEVTISTSNYDCTNYVWLCVCAYRSLQWEISQVYIIMSVDRTVCYVDNMYLPL